jgi:hypothetical protein
MTPPTEQPAEQWPAELSSGMRTRRLRFNITPSLAIDDDDFIFDALIRVTGDFPEGMKAKYVAEIARRLNAAPPAQDATIAAVVALSCGVKVTVRIEGSAAYCNTTHTIDGRRQPAEQGECNGHAERTAAQSS